MPLQPASAQLLHCTLALDRGSATIQSGAAASSQPTHLAASYLSLPAKPATVQPAPRTGLLRLVSNLLGARGVVGTARLAMSVCRPHSGFSAHPAIVDSSLHIGAVLAATLTPQQTAAARVPVAVGLFLAAGPAAGLNGMEDAAGCAALETAGPKAASHYGISTGSAAAAVQLCYLEVWPQCIVCARSSTACMTR